MRRNQYSCVQLQITVNDDAKNMQWQPLKNYGLLYAKKKDKKNAIILCMRIHKSVNDMMHSAINIISYSTDCWLLPQKQQREKENVLEYVFDCSQ